MLGFRRLLPLACLLLLVAFSAACALPAPIARLFATETPTSTATPTSTPTSTPTPLPPINMSFCAFESDCPEALLINSFLSHDPKPGVVSFVTVPYNEHIRIASGWYALGEETIRDNLSKMKWIFEIDGQDYFQPSMIQPGYVADEKSPSVQYPGFWIGADLSGWQLNQPHTVRIGFVFTEGLSDGWDDYPAGYSAVYEYNIEPGILPTDTPTPTPTQTPRPTKTPTPRPTAIPATSTPSCNRDSTISIINSTGGQITMYLTGPAKFTFYIGTGNQTITVCAGQYSYTGYGCGGASLNGTLNAGDEIEFYCY